MRTLAVAVTEADHIRGAADAAITLVEYGDFQCPDCGNAYPVVKQLQERFGERMRLVYRNFPLVAIHRMAEQAAEAAEFAGQQGKFWEMHDAIFENQRRLSLHALEKEAEGLGLDVAAMRGAVEEGAFRERIEWDIGGGKEAGVHGTPTFFINGEAYGGEWTFAGLARAMEGE